MRQFSSEENGYSKKEVNEFLENLSKQTNKIMEKVDWQKERIEQLQSELDHYKDFEKKIKDSLEGEESNQIILSAKNDASRIVNAALEKAQQAEKERLLVEKNIKRLKQKLKLFLEQQNLIVDKIDELEIEESGQPLIPQQRK